jgi:hypothetical protein
MVWNAITGGAGWEPWRELHPLHAPWRRLFSALSASERPRQIHVETT